MWRNKLTNKTYKHKYRIFADQCGYYSHQVNRRDIPIKIIKCVKLPGRIINVDKYGDDHVDFKCCISIKHLITNEILTQCFSTNIIHILFNDTDDLLMLSHQDFLNNIQEI